MRGRLHQWWALVLRHLHERPAQTPSEPGPITDDEVAQLARDSWDLYGDLTRQSVLPCTPVPAREGWRQWSQERVSQPPAGHPSRREEARRWAMQGRISTRLQGGCDKGHV
jgi:hypothetical protein